MSPSQQCFFWKASFNSTLRNYYQVGAWWDSNSSDSSMLIINWWTFFRQNPAFIISLSFCFFFLAVHRTQICILKLTQTMLNVFCVVAKVFKWSWWTVDNILMFLLLFLAVHRTQIYFSTWPVVQLSKIREVFTFYNSGKNRISSCECDSKIEEEYFQKWIGIFVNNDHIEDTLFLPFTNLCILLWFATSELFWPVWLINHFMIIMIEILYYVL